MGTDRIDPRAGFVSPDRLPKGPNGRALCRRCSVEVPPARRTFCSDACIEEWKVRTNPTFARRLVFKRDAGVCALCRLDCDAAERQLHDMVAELRRRGVPLHCLHASWPVAAKDFFLACERFGWRRPGPFVPTLWQMDHVVPVVEGGGACGLDNLRTLCLPCHRDVTNQLRRRRASMRRR